MVETPENSNYRESFRNLHEREFGFILENREIIIENVRVRSMGKYRTITSNEIERISYESESPIPITTT